MTNMTQKKTFVRPELVVYGDIRQLTLAVGATGSNDGATTGSVKSQP